MNALAIFDLVRILLILILAYLAYIDLRTFRLPDAITIPLTILGMYFNSFPSIQFVALSDSIIGALVGYCLLWLLNRLYRHFKKRDGIGMGDAKLLAALGAWLGWGALPGILFLASVTGLIGGMAWLKLNKQSPGSAFPFGPFLVIAGIIELLWPQLLQNLFLISPT
jgi:leader peptidase (prepilin peptidase)/N-methyltransferase